MLHVPSRITAPEHPIHGQGPVPKLPGWAGGGSCWQKSLQLTKTNHKPRVHLILHMEITQGKVSLNTAWNRGWKGWEELVVSEFLGGTCKQGLLNRTVLSQLDLPLCCTLKMLLLPLRCLLPQTS